MADVLKLTYNAFLRNWKMVSFFSLPFFLAFLIPLLAPTPTYLAAGASFLRTGSMYIDLTPIETAEIVASFVVSLFLVSFAVVSLNLVIKSERTFTNIRKEVMEGIGKYVITVFWLYLTAWVLMLIVHLATYESEFAGILSPIAGFIISLPLFYAPTAMVIDEMRPAQALRASVGTLGRQPVLFLLWLVIGIAAITAVDVLAIALAKTVNVPPAFSLVFPIIVLAANALVVLPFLIMMQAETYLAKYTII